MSQCLWSSASRFTSGSMEDGSKGSIGCGTGCGTWLQFLLTFVSRSLHTPATSAASAPDFAKQELERVAYGVCDRREVSFIQGEQHVVKGLYVACHLVTLSRFEASDCGLLSSGLLNVTGQCTLKAANHVLPVAMLTKRSLKHCWRQVAKVALWGVVWLEACLRERALYARAK